MGLFTKNIGLYIYFSEPSFSLSNSFRYPKICHRQLVGESFYEVHDCFFASYVGCILKGGGDSIGSLGHVQTVSARAATCYEVTILTTDGIQVEYEWIDALA